MQFISAMESYTQFIVHSKKIPIDPNSRKAIDPHDPLNWMTYKQALSIIEKQNDLSMGFVFTDHDPFYFIDLDDCIKNGVLTPIAQDILNRFEGAAVEISTSGEGIHIFCIGKVSEHRNKNSEHGIELYHTKRFVALTGVASRGDAGKDCSEQLQWLIDAYFKRGEAIIRNGGEPSTVSGEGLPDEEIIERALNSRSAKSVFDKSPSFKDLWTRNVEVLARAYPPNHTGVHYDESSADAALAQHLAFWAAGNVEQIKRIMYQSALVREKWGERRKNSDYLAVTIEKACARQSNFFNLRSSENPQITIPNKKIEGSGAPLPSRKMSAILTMDDQENYFKGCVYVQDEHKILIPGGSLLTPDRFKVVYGGAVFMLDDRNQRVTRNAFEAFTESQAIVFPRANSTCFRPDLPPGMFMQRNGESLVNSWWPAYIDQAPGDIEPYLNHIALLYPDEEDQKKLLYFFAACVQHQGVKFRWCPVLQGVEGNGKSLLARIVAYAVGERYVHFPKSEELTAKFNSWIYRKTLIIVDDIFVPSHRRDVSESLKPLIDSDRLEIEPKGGDKITREVCANFILSTNHKDGIRKRAETRRFAMFFSAQQTRAGLIQSQMTSRYFQNFVSYLKNGGFKAIAHYLSTLQIPDEYNPAILSLIAPETTSTLEAIELNVTGSKPHLEIMEAIDSYRVGFRNGWISSVALKELAKEHNVYISPTRIKTILEDLNYIPHPDLPEGRSPCVTRFDSVRPRLYILKNKYVKCASQSEVVRKYEEDQALK